MSRGPVIAIDGPAGAGKTTISTGVAARLELPHFDTGAMYRAITLKACRLSIVAEEVDRVMALLPATSVEIRGRRVFLDGEDVTEQVRSREVTAVVSPFAAIPELRAWMVALQREAVGGRGGVVEGRDIGTVVFPDAEVKVFLTAHPEERARRRAGEETGTGDVDATLRSIQERDRLDSERDASPLRAAPDAIVLDTTGISPEEVIDRIIALLEPAANSHDAQEELN